MRIIIMRCIGICNWPCDNVQTAPKYFAVLQDALQLNYKKLFK